MPECEVIRNFVPEPVSLAPQAAQPGEARLRALGR
jgi:hypothetical protein